MNIIMMVILKKATFNEIAGFDEEKDDELFNHCKINNDFIK
ncbi:MAG: hypothetical protein RR189_02440 [Bacilli bacterium]